MSGLSRFKGAFMENAVMKPYTCASIVKEGIRFAIPIYQRLFVWGESQIEKLLQDVKRQEDRAVPYYIGIVTIKRISGENGENDVWELVDGQQRNSFLTLFAAECISRQLDRWSDFVFLDPERQKLRIHYLGREQDEKDIRLLSCGCPEEMENKNFRVFHRVFGRWIDSLREEEWKRIEAYMFSRVSFFASVLPKDYQANELNLYFERMNAAGQQLGLLDIVKGRFFPKYAARIDSAIRFGKEKFVSNSNATCNERTLKEILEDENGPSFREECPDLITVKSVVSPELMMLHVLSAVKGLRPDEVLTDERSLVAVFEEFFSGFEVSLRDKKAQEFLEELEKYRRWIDNNLVYIDQESDDRVYRFRTSDANPCEDIEKNGQGDEGENHVIERLRQFESMLYVCYPNGEQWAYAAYHQFRDRDDMSKKELFSFLRNWDQTRDRLPTLSELNYLQIERRWFWRLDYILWERISFGISDETIVEGIPSVLINGDAHDRRRVSIRNFTFRANRSIEHLHPQTATDASLQERREWNGILYKDSLVRVEDSFGNLAMISSSFNSMQGNDQINAKLARIKDQINENRLESIKLLVMSTLAGDDIARWTVDIAKEHGEAMYQLLKQEYGSVDETESAK